MVCSGCDAQKIEEGWQVMIGNTAMMMNDILKESVYLGVMLTIGTYGLGMWLKNKTGLALMNPLLVALLLCIGFLWFTDTPYELYADGTEIINYMLTPATICLAVPLYEQIEQLKRNPRAIAVGITMGVLSSAFTILALVLILGMEYSDYITLLPKSVTTPLGMSVSAELGGNVPVTIMAIVLTGITGNIIAEPFLKFMNITEPIAKGIAIGSASHVIGTSKALEMGQSEGAMSSLAIVTSGILTVLTSSVFAMIEW